MGENKRPISLKEGKIFINGILIADCVKCEIKFTPDVWTGKVLGERTDSSRWLGYKITGSITRRRSTKWLKDAMKSYLTTGATPEFVIQGIMDDDNSDYYDDNGTDTVTVTGCVLTGDLTLTSFDSGGNVLEETIGFNAKNVA